MDFEVRKEGTDQKLHDSLDISLGEVFCVGVKGLPIFGVVILRRHSPSAHAMRVKLLSRNYRLTPLSRQCISRRFSVWHMPRTHSCFPILQLKRSRGVWQKTTLFFVPFPWSYIIDIANSVHRIIAIYSHVRPSVCPSPSVTSPFNLTLWCSRPTNHIFSESLSSGETLTETKTYKKTNTKTHRHRQIQNAKTQYMLYFS